MNLSLNSFRFFAFFAVFLFHFGFFEAGYIGVQAFFVLSGFLITPILLKTKENSTNFYSYIKNFLTRRFLRIFPLYYAYLFALFLLIVIFNLDKDSEYIFSLKKQLIYGFTYTYNLYNQTIYFEHNKFITHFWSLAVEEQFYLLWPPLIYFTSKTTLKKILIFLLFLTPFFRFVMGYIVENNIFSFLNPDKLLVVYISTFSHFDAFAIGGLFGILPKIQIKNNLIIVSVLLTIAISIGINYYIENDPKFQSHQYSTFMLGFYRHVWGYSILNFVFVLLLMGLNKRTFFPKLFENKAISYLGLISYGLYVYHYGSIAIIEFFQREEIISKSKFLGFFFALFLTIIVSYFSYEFFEKVFIDLKNKLAPKKNISNDIKDLRSI